MVKISSSPLDGPWVNPPRKNQLKNIRNESCGVSWGLGGFILVPPKKRSDVCDRWRAAATWPGRVVPWMGPGVVYPVEAKKG